MLARVDQRKGRSRYEIDLDLETGQPVRIRLITISDLRSSDYQEFRSEMTYELSRFGQVEAFEIPSGARRLLR